MARPTGWTDSLITLQVASGAQGSQSLITEFTTADLRGATIVRLVIKLDPMSQTVAGAWGSQLFDIGIGIVSQDAFAASVFPDPNLSTDRPVRGWMWRTRQVVTQNGISTAIVHTLAADMRSARKIDTGELVIVANNTVHLGTAFTVECRGIVRALVKFA